MAESQESFSYDQILNTALGLRLSQARLAPYLAATHGDVPMAMKTYLWNARLSKAFLYPLQVVEVTVRNAVNTALAQHFNNADWVLAPPFVLTPQSAASYAASNARLRRKKPNPSANDVVAALTFDFWSNLFRDNYDALWNQPGLLSTVFPLMPPAFRRTDIQVRVARINWLRNRIAHHETIHAKIDVVKYLDHVYEMIGFICADTKEWVKKNTTVTKVLYSPPNADAAFVGTPLALLSLRQPPILDPTTPLPEVISRLAKVRPSAGLVPVENADPPYRLINTDMVLSYIATEAAKLEGCIDLSEHAAASVIDSIPAPEVARISINCTTGDATNMFFPKGKAAPRPQALLVTDNARPDPIVGILVKPAVKY